MNVKKTIGRIKLVATNIFKQILSQLLTLVLSAFVFKFYSKELWGEFSASFLYINILTIVMSWGNKEFLIREFSKRPNKMAEQFYLLFNTRLILLVLSVVVLFFLFPVKMACLFSIWITSVYVSQSLEVFWIYKRDYLKSVFVEFISFLVLLLLLYFNTLNGTKLIAYYSFYQFARAAFYVCIYVPELKKIHFHINKKYFSAAVSFFALSIVGFLQSRIDFVIITFFESNKEIAIYQIITTFFILIHALGTFLIFPYMKNIYRLQQKSVDVFQKFISLISPVVVCLCLVVFFLITKYVYNLDLDFEYYVLGFIIAFPPYLYTVKIVTLYKENKQHIVLKTGIKAIAINSLVSVLFLYLGYGLKGALIGSATAQVFTAFQYLANFSNQGKTIYT